MLADFFVRALVAGAGVAAVAGPLGCFIVWRRMAYFGDTLSHAALLGIALALLLNTSATLMVFVASAAVALCLMGLRKNATLSSDALLGILAHGSLAVGLVCLAFMSAVSVDLFSVLFGDILAVSAHDIAVVYAGGAAVLVVLAALWRPLLAATVSRELAEAEGLSPNRSEAALMIMLALVIAIAMKIVGVLLITALLIIPATTARRLAQGPETMAVLAALIGVLAVVAGLYGSLRWDTPAGPSIVVAALVLFIASLSPAANLLTARRPRGGRHG